MYAWREMNASQRKEVLLQRRLDRRPWHSPPHFDYDAPHCFHLTAACLNHSPLIGQTPKRMSDFEADLVATLRDASLELRAWCVLPNHWHAVVKTADLKETLKRLGQLHGRMSRCWNLEDERVGRSCWFCCADRRIRNDAHYFATLNYVHHNPVHHRYVKHWQEWPFSSAEQWLADIGFDEASRIWKEYPLLDYGKGWDDP